MDTMTIMINKFFSNLSIESHFLGNISCQLCSFNLSLLSTYSTTGTVMHTADIKMAKTYSLTSSCLQFWETCQIITSILSTWKNCGNEVIGAGKKATFILAYDRDKGVRNTLRWEDNWKKSEKVNRIYPVIDILIRAVTDSAIHDS
jgi:hypothetical protein